jgi:hypothetical protein
MTRLEAMIARHIKRAATSDIRQAGNAPTMPANLTTRYGMTLDAQ